MSAVLAAGERLALRPVVEADAAGPYLGWMRDPDVTRWLESRFGEHTQDSLAAYIRVTTADERNVFCAIVERDGGRHVGNIKLGPIDAHHRHGDIGIIVGERDRWGRGYATEAIALLARHAFDDLRLHKLTASAYDCNVGSIRAFERAGFEHEGVRRQQHLSDDGWVDSVLLGRVTDREG